MTGKVLSTSTAGITTTLQAHILARIGDAAVYNLPATGTPAFPRTWYLSNSERPIEPPVAAAVVRVLRLYKIS